MRVQGLMAACDKMARVQRLQAATGRRTNRLTTAPACRGSFASCVWSCLSDAIRAFATFWCVFC